MNREIKASIATYDRHLSHYYWAFRHHWGDSAKKVCENIFNIIEAGNSRKKLQRRDHQNLDMKTEKITSQIQLAWYHEMALISHPDIDDNFYEAPFTQLGKKTLIHKQRQHFVGWRVNQAYYALYSAASATLRCFKTDEFAHAQMIKEFNFNCLKEFSPTLFVYPFSVYFSRFRSNDYEFHNTQLPKLINPNSDINCKTDDFKSHNCFDGIKKALSHAYKYQKGLIDQKIIKRKTEPDREFSFLSYMRMMRERLTYSAVKNLVELGDHSPNVPVFFDIALVNLTCFFLFCCEVFLMYFLGPTEMSTIFQEYKENIKKINTNIHCIPLEIRAGLWRN